MLEMVLLPNVYSSDQDIVFDQLQDEDIVCMMMCSDTLSCILLGDHCTGGLDNHIGNFNLRMYRKHYC